MITYLGSFSVGGLLPTLVTLLAGLIPRLQGQLAGVARVQGTIAIKFPTLDARIAAVGRVAAALALQPPGVRVNLSANADLKALLLAQLAIIDDLRIAFGSAGVEVFAFDGPGSAAGEITAALSGGLPGGSPGEHIDALILATRFPSTFTAMGKVFVT